jgi:hypothetical protein
MKQIFAVAFLALTFASCQQFSKPEKPKSGVFYGEKFDTTHAVPASQAIQNVKPTKTVVAGTITKSCQSEGCWVKLDGGDGKELFVSTEDNFTVPKEGMAGLQVYVKGETFTDTTENEVGVSMKATGLAIK